VDKGGELELDALEATAAGEMRLHHRVPVTTERQRSGSTAGGTSGHR